MAVDGPASSSGNSAPLGAWIISVGQGATVQGGSLAGWEFRRMWSLLSLSDDALKSSKLPGIPAALG